MYGKLDKSFDMVYVNRSHPMNILITELMHTPHLKSFSVLCHLVTVCVVLLSIYQLCSSFTKRWWMNTLLQRQATARPCGPCHIWWPWQSILPWSQQHLVSPANSGGTVVEHMRINPKYVGSSPGSVACSFSFLKPFCYTFKKNLEKFRWPAKYPQRKKTTKKLIQFL